MKKTLFALGSLVAVQASAYSQQELAILKEVEKVERQILSTQRSPQKISGEQVDFALPKGIKMRFLAGDPKTLFLAEYLAENENLAHWKGQFFAQQRSAYPLEVLAQLSFMALKQSCANLRDYSIVEKRDNNGKLNAKQPFTLTYFCADKTAAAPYGEGGQMTFIRGTEYSFKFWQSWRPQSAKEAERRFGVAQGKISPTPTALCNPQEKKACKYKHPKPE